MTTTQQLSNGVTINGTVLTVCSYCHPEQSIFEKFPDLAGLKISHGVCLKCKKELMEKYGLGD